MRYLTLPTWSLLALLLCLSISVSAQPPYWPPYPYYPTSRTAAEPAEHVSTSPAETAEHNATSRDEWELEREIRTAIHQGNFAEAYYLWRPRAEGGNADAQYGIGWMYHNGYGLAIDDATAVKWWELAAKQGHTDAIFALGMLYSLGEGEVRRDMSLAVAYYYQASLSGHEDARMLLRTLMAEGDTAARDLMQQLLQDGKVAEITPPAAVVRPKANVRRGPGTQHKVLTTLTEGHLLMPLRREGRWLLVGIKGEGFTGWIHDNLTGRDFLSDPMD
ncbi:MAG: SH3 domain-containing protein [Chromatiales bacterium]|nr:SH3 domain-containing protein [Chromatiales bacterium]